MSNLIERGYIPLDKSWIIRMGVLDLLHGYNNTINFLEKQKPLSDDLKALYNALVDWELKEEIDVGESATLYRFLQFVSWNHGLNKKFIKKRTLKNRKICDNPEIVNWTIKQLLTLDNHTSQWASASVLCGNNEQIESPPFKLKLTYEAVKHWKECRKIGKCWTARYDKTILRQAETFLKLLKKEKVIFVPEQAEDYCFARAFNFITKEEGERKWLSLKGHESNRINEMEIALNLLEKEKIIKSKDHRVVQAVAMLAKATGENIEVKYPEAVNKSWPQFWEFLNNACNL